MEEVKKILYNKKILICFGTRPEYIKVKYFINNFNNIKTCFTGQHSLLENIEVDYKLEICNNIENRFNNILSNVNYNSQFIVRRYKKCFNSRRYNIYFFSCYISVS